MTLEFLRDNFSQDFQILHYFERMKKISKRLDPSIIKEQQILHYFERTKLQR